MPHLDLENRQFIFKIVYFGPGMSGKTTNLLYIHRTLMEKYRGDMLVLDTEEERTLFFDFFPVSLGTVQGFSLKFHLYTIPGQVYYEASRRIILEGADGVVFVADSNTERLDDNLEMYRRMLDNLESYGVDPGSFPIVLQYNKRDFDDILPLGTLEEALELPDRIPVTSSVATTGRGVMQTLKIISKEVIRQFQPTAV
ncbi:MAG TPA: ADP-ribosylation factor-like protein [Candidatus Sabulitectum sp.]|nr:ADP-ribosylation factor-like protein [Candidatus Sabulitectum sp.]HPF32703.1 ADP-ribosylation factor-like protein [Candidatus Sabulitectum sp.]HPJ27931.1 ADP-ribosylation factor-like protein [Candidatus Sabulitectum sp.]HPR21734.1 ADP-ribosylation factor-like protein [Candidatus Sabulitectum sp.]